MSRIGKQTIQLPAGVTATLNDQVLTVKGPKGELTRVLHPTITVTIGDGVMNVTVSKPEEKTHRSLWGTFAAHLKNMVIGVTKGFEKKLEVNGVGYRVALQGTNLKLEVGYTNPVLYSVPQGVIATVEKNVITLTSADKELLGGTAAEIRAVRKPEPYKGKGIKYQDEVLRTKAGKAASKAAA